MGLLYFYLPLRSRLQALPPLLPQTPLKPASHTVGWLALGCIGHGAVVGGMVGCSIGVRGAGGVVEGVGGGEGRVAVAIGGGGGELGTCIVELEVWRRGTLGWRRSGVVVGWGIVDLGWAAMV